MWFYSFPVTYAEYAGLGMLVQSANTDLTDIKFQMDKFRTEFA